MDHRSEVREFLSTRRARLTPERAGLPAWSAGGHRRVPGLRREEVALLAGVSVDYYTRLERGDLSGASDSVLDALARGLQLDEAETAHLFDLARTANASPGARRPRAKTDAVRPSIQRLLDAMTDAPAILRNNYFDYVAANALGRALYSPVFGDPAPNSARFAFLDPAARDFYPEWDKNTQDLVATMRGEAGRNPFDRRLTDLMGELSTRSERFRALWAAHNNYFDYVAANALGRALYSPVFGDPAPNSARFAFLDPAARDFYPEWDKNTQDLVATMRGEAGRNPFDRRLTDLVGELSTRSERFRALWAAHNVRYHRSGVKRLHHPLVGEMELTYEAFELPADPGFTLSTYTAEPGSPSADALRMLASWAATTDLPSPRAAAPTERA